MSTAEENPIYNSLIDLSKDLKLSFETQDWGIINADADRVAEFINYVQKNSNLYKKVKFELLELIIASVNEAILEGKFTRTQEKKFRDYLEFYIGDEDYLPIIPYWKSIGNEDEFPVGVLLNEIMK